MAKEYKAEKVQLGEYNHNWARVEYDPGKPGRIYMNLSYGRFKMMVGMDAKDTEALSKSLAKLGKLAKRDIMDR